MSKPLSPSENLQGKTPNQALLTSPHFSCLPPIHQCLFLGYCPRFPLFSCPWQFRHTHIHTQNTTHTHTLAATVSILKHLSIRPHSLAQNSFCTFPSYFFFNPNITQGLCPPSHLLLSPLLTPDQISHWSSNILSSYYPHCLYYIHCFLSLKHSFHHLRVGHFSHGSDLC